MTFSCHVFPQTIFSIPYKVVFFTVLLIQYAECFKFQLSNTTWDFAVVHGRDVTFSSLNSSGLRQKISIPAPTSSIEDLQWLSQNSTSNLFRLNSTTNSTTNNTTNDDEGSGSSHIATSTAKPVNWRNSGSFMKLEVDVRRELIFLTSSSGKIQSIVVFNITSNHTYSLVTKDSLAPISGLVHHNEGLYWTDPTDNAIWRMNTSNEITTWKPEAEPFYKLSSPECTRSELAIDAKTNKFFFVEKCSKVYKIQYFNGTHNGTVTESSNKLHALTTDASYLYWVDHPGDFSIQRVSLSDLHGMPQNLYKDRNDYVESLSIVGSPQNVDPSVTESLLWSSCTHKRVVQKDNFSRGSVRTKTRRYGGYCPRGLISRNFAIKDWSSSSSGKKEESANVNNEDNASPTNNFNPPLVMENLSSSMSIKDNTTANERTTFTTTTTPKVAISTTASLTSTTTTATPSTTTTSTTTTTTTLASTSSSSSEVPTTTTKPLNNISTTMINATATENKNNSKIMNDSSSLIPPPPSISPVSQLNPLYYPSVRTGAGPLEIALIVLSSSLLVLVVILLMAVTFLYKKVRRLQLKPRIRRRVIVSRSRDNNVPSPSMCELIDIENCCNMNECETPCYERLGPGSSNSSYKSEGKARTEDKERLIAT